LIVRVRVVVSSVSVSIVDVFEAICGFARDVRLTIAAPSAVAIDRMAVALYTAFGLFSRMVVSTARWL